MPPTPYATPPCARVRAARAPSRHAADRLARFLSTSRTAARTGCHCRPPVRCLPGPPLRRSSPRVSSTPIAASTASTSTSRAASHFTANHRRQQRRRCCSLRLCPERLTPISTAPSAAPSQLTLAEIAQRLTSPAGVAQAGSGLVCSCWKYAA